MNNRRTFIKQLSGAVAGVSLGSLPFGAQAAQKEVKLSILHTNDMHCHIDPFPESNPQHAGKGGMGRLLALIDQIRAENPNTLLFDGGDMFQGTPYFNYFKGELMFRVMTKMGYDAGTLGNHEFDNGLQGLAAPLPHAGFPIINSNYDFSGSILNGKFAAHKIFRKEGLKIGVYGLGIDPVGLIAAKNFATVLFNDPLQTALKMEKFLKTEKRCDMVICLSHLGFQYRDEQVSDKVIAAQTHHTDLIIGGHTHTFLDQPSEIKNKDGKTVLVNQVGWGGMALGRIDFVFNRISGKKEAIFAQNSAI